MNIFHRVTLQSLKENKTRTIVTIIGIMLSAAMICAVTTLVASTQNYLLESAIASRGDWHSAVKNVDAELYHEIKNADEVSGTTYDHILGYAKIESKNELKPYLYVLGAEQNSFFDMMPVHLVSGAYPQNADELMIPEHVISDGGLTYRVGDTLTLRLGERMLGGLVMTQDDPCYEWSEEQNEEVYNGETLEVRQSRTYTIVGIYERPSFEGYAAPGYTALTVSDSDFDGSARFDVYFKMHKPAKVYDFMKKLQISGTQNNDVLMFMGVSRYGNFSDVLVSLAAIIITLIMFGSVSLIYNAFSISVSERTKQFGLLSSIGATRKQLRKMVFFEALTVSAIGIPLGILAGIGGIGTTLVLLGDKFTSMFSSYDEPMHLCVSWASILAAVVVALITVLISAWIPSKRATKVSAVEAIRQNGDIFVKKQAKTSKLTYKLFGLPGVLASKHYKRNRKKYRTTVISLFMSIVLFVSTAAFTDYLTRSVSGGFDSNDFEIFYRAQEEDLTERSPDDILALLTSDQNVTNGAYTFHDVFYGEISPEYLTEQYFEMAGEEGPYTVSGIYHFINEDAFNELLSENKLDKAAFYDPANPAGLVIDQSTFFDPGQERFITLDTLRSDECAVSCIFKRDEYQGYAYAGEQENEQGDTVVIYKDPENDGDMIEVPPEEVSDQVLLRSVKTVTEFPFYVDKGAEVHLNMIYPLSMLENVLPEALRQKMSCDFYLQSDDHAASYENLKTVLLENNMETRNLLDYAKGEESNRNTVIIIQVFSYGFIVLISLIAAANVFNTISTNISLRRREFAMLKSVGMTQKGFHKMMNFECLLYGSKALILGLPVSAGVAYWIYRVFTGAYESRYRLPWGAIGISVLSVFLVVFATMLYAMSRVKKENPVDALKNENL